MSLLITKSGLLDTIQDTGRNGFGKWGINPGGAMDLYAAQMANALVGNNLSDATIELHFPSSQIVFQKDVLISLTGADFTPFINSTAVPVWKPVVVKKDSILSLHYKKQGNRCYLACHVGFELSPWLGSYSTNLKIAAGGLNGKALQKV